MAYYYKAGVIVPFVQKFYKQTLVVIAGLFIASMVAMTLNANAVTTTAIVTPDNLALPSSPATITDSWYFYDDTNNVGHDSVSPGKYEFTPGPNNPLLGDDSISFNLSAANERWNIATNRFAGQKLVDWSSLSFDMYTPSTSLGGTSTTLFLNFDVDFDTTVPGTGYAGVSLPFFPYQHRLVYVPQQNGSPTLNTWETWNAGADNAMWSWSRFVSNGNKWPDGNTNEFRTLQELKTAFPNIGVFNEGAAGQFLIRAGHPGPVGLKGSVDNIVVDEVAYNFELSKAPTTKDSCKNGGWSSFNTPVFKNQGQCVAFVASGGKNIR